MSAGMTSSSKTGKNTYLYLFCEALTQQTHSAVINQVLPSGFHEFIDSSRLQDDCLAINRGKNIVFEDNYCESGHGASIVRVSFSTKWIKS